MSWIKNYSVSGDFSAGVAPRRFQDELDADAGITTTIEGVRVLGDDCDVVWESEPGAGEKTAADAVVAAHGGTPYAGEVLKYGASEGDSDTGSTDWQDKLTLSKDHVQPGWYLIRWYVETYSSDGEGEVRVIIDSTTLGQVDSTVDVAGFSGFIGLDLEGGSESVKIQYRHKDGGGTTYVSRARLHLCGDCSEVA